MIPFVRIAKSVVDNPAFESRGNITYCNWALRLIANAAFSYNGFDNKTANDIYDMVSKGEDGWKKVSDLEAHNLASSAMVIAAQRNNAGSGHVAFVVPDSMVMSGKYKKLVPIVANVGKKNGFMGVNWAFGNEPEYFAR